jgi:hypothetical protein
MAGKLLKCEPSSGLIPAVKAAAFALMLREKAR